MQEERGVKIDWTSSCTFVAFSRSGFIDRSRRARERKERSFGVHRKGVEPGLSTVAAPIMQRLSHPPTSPAAALAILF